MEFEQVCQVVAETLGCELESVTREANLFEELGADSLSAVELMMAMEEVSGVTIDDEAMPSLKTVGDIMAYLDAHKE